MFPVYMLCSSVNTHTFDIRKRLSAMGYRRDYDEGAMFPCTFLSYFVENLSIGVYVDC